VAAPRYRFEGKADRVAVPRSPECVAGVLVPSEVLSGLKSAGVTASSQPPALQYN
jgi:hypothetical protein